MEGVMGLPAIFGQSFLDGFTMAGFPFGLRRPDAATMLFEPEAEPNETPAPIVFELLTRGEGRSGVRVRSSELSLETLQLLQEELLRELQKRDKAAHGTI